VVEEIEDRRRTEPLFLLPERRMLEGWLDYQRITLLITCEGLDNAGRKMRPVATSALSLHGLVRHMAEVEQDWFRRVLLDDADAPFLFSDPAVEDSELVSLDDADWESDVAAWQHQCEASRREAARRQLDDTGVRYGEPCSLRWIYHHMIEEYARHNGHADLIREMVDSDVGR
jgi:uncharacterized damage-inducible protein DinB